MITGQITTTKEYATFIQASQKLKDTAARLDRFATDGDQGHFDEEWAENLKAEMTGIWAEAHKTGRALETLIKAAQ